MNSQNEPKTRKVFIAGYLYTQGKKYFLLSPEPVVKDSWQRDYERRFSVIPARAEVFNIDGYAEYVYPYARHIIVSGDYLIEIVNAKNTILVEQLEEQLEESDNWAGAFGYE